MKKAVIFDMDGTLWDSSKQVTDSWNVVFEKNDLKNITYTDMQNCMGLMMNDIIKRLFPSLCESEQLRILKECEEFENEYLSTHCGQLYPQLKSTLISLKKLGYKLMIVTNAQDGYVQAFFKSSGLEKYFDDFEMFGRTNLPKSENIRLILERNNISDAVYVGDTIWDYDSAKSVDVEFIHASYGFGKVSQSNHKIKTLPELVELVPKII